MFAESYTILSHKEWAGALETGRCKFDLPATMYGGSELELYNLSQELYNLSRNAQLQERD
jgi:hypothetical protein